MITIKREIPIPAQVPVSRFTETISTSIITLF